MKASNLDELANWARHRTGIVVCGAPRSGTQIAGRILAAELADALWLDYHTVHLDFRGLDVLQHHLAEHQRFVVHHPLMLYLVPLLLTDERMGVVTVQRDPADVLLSRRRIHYSGLRQECSALGLPEPCTDTAAIEAAHKRAHAWQDSPGLAVVDYAVLQAHRLFVQDRAGWEAHRWQ
jgi:hypothetical protein